MACADLQRLQAYFDGEVDALTAAAIERHVEGCCECRHQLEGLERTRAGLRRHLPLEPASAALRARLAQALDREAKSARAQTHARRPWRLPPVWLGALGGAAAGAMVTATLMMAVLPGHADMADALEAAHVRSLMPSHLLDVESSEHHTVKPWFAGHTDVSPVVGDFPDAGYRLLGARADYMWGRRVAVLVYRHGAHVINVFSWPGDTHVPASTSRAGYHISCWRAGDLAYCAVSDSGWEELAGLARRLQDLAAHDTVRE
jgi:anti-sigma factor RsiW